MAIPENSQSDRRDNGAPSYWQPSYGAADSVGTADSTLVSRLADPFSRLLARIIDFLVVAPLSIIVAVLAGVKHGPNVIIGVLIMFGAILGYEWFFLAWGGQTIGKKIMGIRVIPLAGGIRTPLSGGQASRRTAAYFLIPFVPFFGAIYAMLDQLWLLWDQPWRQCLHDKIANTIVVRA